MDIKNLIAECTAYDFKVALEEKKPKSWLKSVSAFANEYGGSLFFGVDNEGNVRGLEDIAHVTEAIRNAVKAYMDPLIEAGLIAMTHPDSPKSPKQKYYLSEYGRSLLENQPTSDAGSKVSRLLAELRLSERRA